MLAHISLLILVSQFNMSCFSSVSQTSSIPLSILPEKPANMTIDRISRPCINLLLFCDWWGITYELLSPFFLYLRQEEGYYSKTLKSELLTKNECNLIFLKEKYKKKSYQEEKFLSCSIFIYNDRILFPNENVLLLCLYMLKIKNNYWRNVMPKPCRKIYKTLLLRHFTANIKISTVENLDF